MHSIDNLFKLNELNINKKNTNYESMSIDELKQNEKKFKQIVTNKKLISSLTDKGERIKQQLKQIESLIESHTKQLQQQHQHEISNKENKLNDLIDKIQEIKIEKSKQETKSAENQSIKTNYFARLIKKQNKSSTKPLVNKENLNLDEVKQKIKFKLEEQGKVTRSAKEIPFDECVKLLQEREKRVQEFQLEQTAKKLIEGQSVTYDYSFAAKAENLKYQERKYRTNRNDDLLSDNESDLEDEDEYDYYEYYDDLEELDEKSSKIDRVYKTKLEKNKFKPNLDDLEKVD